ncbi:hypothetical protein GCM10009839_31420 [Catenulispora yoronensis]|uniref:Luciferase-like domain-containing protein n=1 Tax=Catenulispora yoronensis TaxID=450799 RepID=A0ABN2U4Z4_9ACTN
MLHLIASLHVPGNHEVDDFVDLARTAERGLLDSVFLDDFLALPGPDSVVAGGLEPLTLLAAVATATEHIGLITTASTTFSEPFPLARSLASLDHISHGRAGWNMGTGGGLDEAANFSMDEPVEAAVRYERAAELLDVVTQLWDSWADDATVRRERVREIEHIGLFFKVRGPLNVRRTPQGWPLLVHRAEPTSDDMEFAARYAEVVFTGQRDIREAASFAYEVKSRAAAYGREPFLPLIVPGLVPTGSAEQIADLMQEWAEAGAADGFAVHAQAAPGGLPRFVDHVVPVLQRRGLFRTAYDGGTLRERFGLPRPEDHFPAFEAQTLPRPALAWPALAAAV